jgi:hypothetical protein
MDRIKNYQPEIYGVIFFIMLLNVWYLSGIAIENAVLPKGYGIFISFLIPTISGFIGAFAAFSLKTWEETKKVRGFEVSALNKSLFILHRQINSIANTRRSLNNYREDAGRTINLPPSVGIEHSDAKQDFEGLNFLISKGKSNLLLGISIEQERFDLAIWTIKHRNDLHLNQFQPAFEESNLASEAEVSEQKMISEIGERIYMSLHQATENVYTCVDKTYASLQEMQLQLIEIAKELYPDADFVRIELFEQE